MSRKIRLGALAALSLLLTACPTTMPRKQGQGTHTPNIPHTPQIPHQPAGNAVSHGTTLQPTGSSATYRAVSFHELPQWNEQSFGDSLAAFKKSCLKLANQAKWQYTCARANQTAHSTAAAKAFFEQNFTPWQVSERGQAGGKVTGYYEPVLHGDTRNTSTARFPIYGIPSDFVSIPLPANLRNSKATVRVAPAGNNRGVIQSNGAYIANLAQFPITARSTALKGRFVGNQFVPYFTRAQINAGALNGRAPILGYANDPVELFFMHIQGSGRLRTPAGNFVRLGFADKNEYPYVSIGQYMSTRGYLPLAQTSMQNIKSWMGKNPNHLAEVLGQNPSYVFFKVLDGSSDQGPVGALGVPLTGGYSGAVDKHHITLGAPLFLATSHPANANAGLNRLIVAQDTGSAIKGAVRVDYFWGYGDEAGQMAGRHNTTGYVWQLLPHGVLPSYQP
nr:MltA domain-containing protein [uncultured Kingella sp.]